MRKINSSMENPFDDIILGSCDGQLEILYRMGFTPNLLTLIGVIFRIWSIWSLFNGNKLFFLIGGIIGYYFDCLDGHFARRYDMCTQFGDIFDHLSDTLFQVGILYYLLVKSKLPHSKFFIPIVILYVCFALLLFCHMGCQQQHTELDFSESLDHLQHLCPDKEWIYWTRYFGCGTAMIFSLALGAIF